jgi:hypothetical protein
MTHLTHATAVMLFLEPMLAGVRDCCCDSMCSDQWQQGPCRFCLQSMQPTMGMIPSPTQSLCQLGSAPRPQHKNFAESQFICHVRAWIRQESFSHSTSFHHCWLVASTQRWKMLIIAKTFPNRAIYIYIIHIYIIYNIYIIYIMYIIVYIYIYIASITYHIYVYIYYLYIYIIHIYIIYNIYIYMYIQFISYMLYYVYIYCFYNISYIYMYTYIIYIYIYIIHIYNL